MGGAKRNRIHAVKRAAGRARVQRPEGRAKSIILINFPSLRLQGLPCRRSIDNQHTFLVLAARPSMEFQTY